MRYLSQLPRMGSAALLATAFALALYGCSSSSDGPQGAAGAAGHATDNGFESDNPGGNQSRGPGYNGSEDGAAGSSAGGGQQPPGAAERAIQEADIIQVKGPRLYALSQYTGLSVIDISQRDHLQLLGRYRTQAMPFEMIVRDDVVLAMFSSYPLYTWDAATQQYKWVDTSRVLALDTANPASIQLAGSYEIPGVISDSRLVGNVFYVVSYQDAGCWECDAVPNTTVLSLNVADPHAISQVGKLTYTNPNNRQGYSWYRRSISVTQDRMYVAGIEWDQNWNEGHSTIQAVDISDPGGALVQGASFAVQGQIESRWQMDEYQGVLRVISQPGVWSSQEPPSIQTFRVNSSQDIQPLAQMNITLPQPEDLRSVRFDGTRAYAITAQQMDPLFTFDLTDPQHPQQVGALEMPGWIYHMEPRGDRLIALGFDFNNTSNGSLTVSTFDVSNLASPTMLARVNFGGNWAWAPEDQDRIHKAFQVLDDQSLILVPFSGWSYDTGGCGHYDSGIQLIDFTRDTLALRGVAGQKGYPRRAFLHDERLFAVSDSSVSTFDIANRDQPQQKAELALADNTTKSVIAGDKLVKLAADWWTGANQLAIVPVSNPEQNDPIGTLDLSVLNTQNPQGSCYGYSNIAYSSQLFANGNLVYLVWSDYYYYDPSGTSQTRIAVFDVTDGAHPQLVSNTALNIPASYYYYGYYGYYYGGYSTLLSSGQPVLQKGSTLAFWNMTYPAYGSTDPITTQLYLVDLSNAAQPVVSSIVPLPTGLGATPPILVDSTLMSSHWEPVAGDADRVRFYVDRVDITNPSAPNVLASINVPGSLVSFDSASHHMVTADYQRVTVNAATYEQCYTQFGGWASFDSEHSLCTGYHRFLKLLDIDDSNATLLDTLALDDISMGNVALGTDRIFINEYPNYYYYWGVADGAGTGTSTTPDTTNKLVTVGGIAAGHFEQAPVLTLSQGYWSYGTVFAQGTKAIVTNSYPPSVTVFDSANLSVAPVQVNRKDLYGYGYISDIDFTADKAICSLAEYGVQSVPLSAQ